MRSDGKQNQRAAREQLGVPDNTKSSRRIALDSAATDQKGLRMEKLEFWVGVVRDVVLIAEDETDDGWRQEW
jgi:uncharacterized caspase-like protein